MWNGFKGGLHFPQYLPGLVASIVICEVSYSRYIYEFILLFLYCSDDVSELYPVSRLEQEVKGEKDIYGPGNLQDTYYQVIVLLSFWLL